MNPDIRPTTDQRGVIITINGTDYTDSINDGTVKIIVQRDQFKLVAAVIHGNERDLVYGYAVANTHAFRSPLWRDVTTGVLNLTSVDWHGMYQFSIANRDTMTFDGAQTWTVTNNPGSRIDGVNTVIA